MTLLDLQHADGHWEGEVVWNTMLLSQYLMTHHILDSRALSEVDLKAARKHYELTVLDDGSWPFHCDGEEGSLYVTTLAYVALRLIGTPADDPLAVKAREWMHRRPHGVAAVPTWGRMWLAVLGLYPYEGINPIPPELALLPGVVQRMYCHTRHVYLGLAYLYGARFRMSVNDEIRTELFGEKTDFRRHEIDDGDLFQRPIWPLRRGYDLLTSYERRPSRRLRAKAMRRCAELAERELAASNGQCLSPVNGLLACLVLAHAGEPREQVLKRLATLDVWRWQDEEKGLRITGANSAIWETSFAMRALAAGGAPEEPLKKAHEWLLGTQVVDELPPELREGRDQVAGGWCFFRDRTIRWPVSDSTAEALSALLLTDEAIGTETPAERARLAATFIMSRQNPDGGFGTYERTRAPGWVEKLNPSEMYHGCMTDLSHVECTASCVSALVRYRRRWPDPRVDDAITRGVAFIRTQQRPDGSYRGAWGINFTYAAFFVVEALTEAGVPVDDPAIAGVADWLLRHQREDGGWGEHHLSCRTGEYVPHPHGQRTMTGWAVLALTRAIGAEHGEVIRAAQFLDWPQTVREAASGVFFGTAVLDYSLYRSIFPVWATNVVEGFTRQPS